jgi:hypothetical protein
VDDNDRRRHAVLLCEHDRRHGFPFEPLRWWLWWLREEQLLRSRAHLLRSGPDLLRSRHLRRSRDLRRARGELLQFRLQIELLQIAVPQPQVELPPDEVLQQVKLLRSGPELLRSGPELLCSGRADLRCSDLRCSDGFRLQLV